MRPQLEMNEVQVSAIILACVLLGMTAAFIAVLVLYTTGNPSGNDMAGINTEHETNGDKVHNDTEENEENTVPTNPTEHNHLSRTKDNHFSTMEENGVNSAKHTCHEDKTGDGMASGAYGSERGPNEDNRPTNTEDEAHHNSEENAEIEAFVSQNETNETFNRNVEYLNTDEQKVENLEKRLEEQIGNPSGNDMAGINTEHETNGDKVPTDTEENEENTVPTNPTEDNQFTKENEEKRALPILTEDNQFKTTEENSFHSTKNKKYETNGDKLPTHTEGNEKDKVLTIPTEDNEFTKENEENKVLTISTEDSTHHYSEENAEPMECVWQIERNYSKFSSSTEEKKANEDLTKPEYKIGDIIPYGSERGPNEDNRPTNTEDETHHHSEENAEIEAFVSQNETNETFNHNVEYLNTEEQRKREVEHLEKRLEEQIAANADLIHRIIAAEKSADDTEEIKRQMEALRGENQSMQETLKTERRSKEALEESVKQLLEEISTCTQENGELSAKADRLRGQYENAKKELNEKSETLKTERRSKEELEESVKQLREEISTCTQENGELSERAKQEKEKQQSLVQERNQIIQALQTNISQLKNDLQAKELECESSKAETKINKAHSSALERNVAQLEISLQQKETQKNSALEFMQNAIAERDQMAYQMGTLQNIKLEKETLQRSYQRLLEENTKMNESLQEYGVLRDHIQEYYKGWQDSQMELHREREKNRHFNEIFSTTGHRLHTMSSDLQNYRSMAENYRQSLEEKKEECHQKIRDLDRLTHEVSKLEEDLQKCTEESFELKDQIRSLEKDLDMSQSECSRLKNSGQSSSMKLPGWNDATDCTDRKSLF